MQNQPTAGPAPARPATRVPWTKRLAPFHRAWTDPLVALAGTAVTAVRVLDAARDFDPHGRGNPPLEGPAALAVALLATVALGTALAVRRRWPAASCWIAVLAWAVSVAGCRQPAVGLVVGAWAVPVGALAVYAAAAEDRRAGWAGHGRAALGAAVLGWAVTATAPDEVFGNLPLAVLAQTAAWAVGRAVRGHRAHTAVAAERRAALERAARSEERLLLAQEVHDVVAHSLGVVSVQAGFGQYALAHAGADGGAEAAGTALAAIRAVSTDALRETRTLLAVLREDTGPRERPPVPGPAPGLAAVDLRRLAEWAGTGGVAVEVRIRGRERELPPGVGLSGYRILREALANVVRHAGAARARVEVEYRDDELWLEVTDDGPGDGARPRPAPPAASVGTGGTGGTGLAGMRERVAPYGGWCVAGPTPAGGFRVSAGLPLAGADSSSATGVDSAATERRS
ncbi:histidine kinase [Kitasatospora purpeofusca]|uniref:sensor histidine kinase n=1 Tax=Kitasatospora purpeofusca TaxID=67352 RepID=UPI0022564D0B|nr:histidine kinase [Kitasatospora purpeofusca]MCX4684353.1 histidine kinase [Kitasatospora purpeofusca]